MEKGPKVCFCSPGVIVFREVLSFHDEGARHGFPNKFFRSQYFPESWDCQWFIEVKVNSTDFYVGQAKYGKSPKASFVLKLGALAPVTLLWPAKHASAMRATFPSSHIRSIITSTGFLLYHVITMNVTLTVPLEGENAHLAKNQCFEFHEQFKTMFEDQLGSDVTIITTNGQMTAHWAVLAARSPFFAAMTKFDYKEKQENKIVVEISYETCKQMLRFIYSNQMEITQEEEGRELLRAGDIYLIDGLKAAAGNFLCSHVTPSNSVELLILSHLHNAIQLKMKAMDVILESSKSVVEHERFPDLCKYPDLVAELALARDQKVLV